MKRSYLTNKCPGGWTQKAWFFVLISLLNLSVWSYASATPSLSTESVFTQLACNDQVNISLGIDCEATVTPDMILEGGPYPNQSGFVVTLRDWNTNALVDSDPSQPGAQVGKAQVHKYVRATVYDPVSGNSCWGKALIEDKFAPILECPLSVKIACDEDSSPEAIGYPMVTENCGTFTLTYKDIEEKGNCGSGFEKIITRTFTAVDEWGNKSSCTMTISVYFVNLSDLKPPPNYDNLDEPALLCGEKYDAKFNPRSHYAPAPHCVDDVILDLTGKGWPGERRPRILGWNCIDAGAFAGHPNPDPIYYPANPGCWGDNEYVMWLGTGRFGGKGCSNISSTFKDTRLDLAKPGCDAGDVGCYKILRQWIVLDWCTGDILEHPQIIKVMDNEGPTVLFPDAVVVSSDPWKCYGRWEVPPVWITDNCSNDVHYTVRVEEGTVLGNENSGYVIVDMPLGYQDAYIVAEDCCGNITEKLIRLHVVDDSPPIAVCDQTTTVSISSGSNPQETTTKVFASTFDDGSFDNCATHLYFKVIRMEELLGTSNGSSSNNTTVCNGANGDDDGISGNQVYFDDFVKFCCADAGNTIRVVFRVYDADPGAGPVYPSRMNQGGDLFGHFSDCMVNVEVQDKSIPTVVAPPDVVISCDYWLDINDLNDVNWGGLGKVVNDVSLRTKVKTTDRVCGQYCEADPVTHYPGNTGNPNSAGSKACNYYNALFNPAHPENKYELAWGLDGYVLSACSANLTVRVVDLRKCGQGLIQRIYSVRGPNNVLVSATQNIWIVDCTPFYVSRDKCDPNDDITWPDCANVGTKIEGCGANISPDNPLLGRPTIENGADDHCSLISIDYKDEIFTIEPDACFKVLRHWIVIDWCRYDPNAREIEGRWEHIQVIKVNDSKKPIVECHVGPCEPAVLSRQLGTCVGHIRLHATATDECSPQDWLFFEYKLDAFNNGSIDYTVGKLTRRAYDLGQIPAIRNNPFADNVNNPFDASGTYPIGTHRITWYVEDGCGNVGTCSTLFEVKDCKAPTPYCLTGIITVPMPTSGCVTVWAKDLDAGSFDNCTDKSKLKFYFDGDPTKIGKTICCSDFVAAGQNDELIVDVEVWVEDEEGNRDFCKTFVIVQDNQNICPNKGSLHPGVISGLVRTETNSTTTKVTAKLYNELGNLVKTKVVTPEGKYEFSDLEVNKSYTIKLFRNDDPLNGVTTGDIVKIQRHILGIANLESNYKLIAADANHTSSVTASDISTIRKLILGNINQFPTGESWDFIPKAHKFEDNDDMVFTNSSTVTLTEAKPTSEVDWTSVKMGDVNNNAVANIQGGSGSRTSKPLTLQVDEQSLQAGSMYAIEVYAKNYNAVFGYQFTMEFNPALVSFEGIDAMANQITEANIGLSQVDKGIVTISYNTNEVMNISKAQALFSIKLKALQNTSLSKVMNINSALTSAEAYDVAYNTMDVNLEIRSESVLVQNDFALFQNNPNPFDKETVIAFHLPESMPAKLTIYDMTGKVIKLMEVSGNKGMNEVTIAKGQIPTSGVVYYQLDAKDFTATKRMIIIE